MKKRLENKLTMYEGLLALLTENSAKTQATTGFGDAVKEFGTIVACLKAKSIEVDESTIGKTSHKHSTEDALIAVLIPVCSALYMYGRKQNNKEITERVNINESKLRSMRDTELASFGKAVADIAAEAGENIAAFGITSEKVTELMTRSREYNEAIGAKESSVASRKGARGSMHDLFDMADDLLNGKLDRFMEILRPVDLELYNKYFAARMIKDTGVRHRTNETEEKAAEKETAEVGVK